MGLLAGSKKFTLHYSGKGVGGCNLPFDSLFDALDYARSRYATEARIENQVGTVYVFTRPDCRHSWRCTS